LPPVLNHCFELMDAVVSSGSSSGLSSILLSTQMILSLICGLLSSLGRKAFGQMSILALSTCSSFIVSEAREVLCASYSGLAVLKQIIQLMSVVATTSASMSSSVAYQIDITTTIMSFAIAHFQDPRICAELLQSTLKAGTVSIACYWQHKNLAKWRGTGPAVVINTVGGNAAVPEGEGDSSVLPIAKLLVQLFMGSMDPAVPPHEAQEAVDGIRFLMNEHNLLSVRWFLTGGCWEGVAGAVLRALLLQSHPTLQEGLQEILDALIKSDLSSAAAVVPALSQGVWSYIGNEVYRCATDIGYGDRAAQLMNAVIAKYTDANRIDAAIFIQEVVQPLSVSISKSKDISL
jgi:hypothetical protein